VALTLETLDIAVLCGGPGAEREVSLDSGTAVTRGLREAGLQARRIEISGDPEEIRALACDIAFLALHGEFGEDGRIQLLLDERGVPYTGSSAACSTLTINKVETKRRLVGSGLPTPRWAEFRDARGAAQAMRAADLAVPVVVKPVSRGSSVGTTIVRDAAALERAAADALRWDACGMIESFVAGPEITAGILADQALPLIELRPAREFYDYEAKYKDDHTQYLCPAPLDADHTAELQALALRVCRVLGVEHMGRVDLMLGEDGPQVLEVNTIPGFTSHSLLPMAARQAGFPFPALCRRILELAWERSGRNIKSAARPGGKSRAEG